MSVDTATGFLTLANPSFDLRRLVKTSDELLFGDDFRTILVDQPKLSNRERLPKSMTLEEDEVALSKTQLPNTFFQQSIGLYVIDRHQLIVDLLLQELTDLEVHTTHGTYDTYKAGCTGPMCRRAIRQERAIAEALRRARTDGNTGKSKHLVRPNNWKDRVKRAAPQYAAVDPLTIAFTVLSHRGTPPERPTKESKTYLELTDNEKLYNFLKQEYPEIVR